MTTHAMNCTAFDETLADYLEGDLGVSERPVVEAHLASCVRCAALVRDLQRIRDSAGELGELVPSRDLWAGIATRIEAPVVSLAPRAALRPRSAERLRLAAVAAALVAVTAGVTYTLTSRGAVAPDGAVALVTARGRSNDSGLGVAPNDSAPVTAPAAPAVATNDSAPASEGRAEDATSTGRPATQAVGNSSETNAGSSSSREIDRLRTIFLRNRSQLDPRTAAIIEANLKVIDDAIAQSKAALSQDPASRFLNNQLNNALGKKLELLKTAAQLPSRT